MGSDCGWYREKSEESTKYARLSGAATKPADRQSKYDEHSPRQVHGAHAERIPLGTMASTYCALVIAELSSAAIGPRLRRFKALLVPVAQRRDKKFTASRQCKQGVALGKVNNVDVILQRHRAQGVEYLPFIVKIFSGTATENVQHVHTALD